MVCFPPLRFVSIIYSIRWTSLVINWSSYHSVVLLSLLPKNLQLSTSWGHVNQWQFKLLNGNWSYWIAIADAVLNCSCDQLTAVWIWTHLLWWRHNRPMAVWLSAYNKPISVWSRRKVNRPRGFQLVHYPSLLIIARIVEILERGNVLQETRRLLNPEIGLGKDSARDLENCARGWGLRKPVLSGCATWPPPAERASMIDGDKSRDEKEAVGGGGWRIGVRRNQLVA